MRDIRVSCQPESLTPYRQQGELPALGLIPSHTGLTWCLVRELTRLAVAVVRQFVEDPSGAVRRIGDVLVWDGPKGQEVIAGLESLSESQARIQQVVGNIEQAQIGITAGLGTLTSLSMATLGLGALAAGFMLHRLNALDKRLEGFGNQLADIKAVLGSQNRAHLGTALQHLQFFEDRRLPAGANAPIQVMKAGNCIRAGYSCPK